MIVGCVLPLLLIFLAPVIGIEGNIPLFTFLLVLFGVHLLLPIKHKGHIHGLSEENYEKKQAENLKKDSPPAKKVRSH